MEKAANSVGSNSNTNRRNDGMDRFGADVLLKIFGFLDPWDLGRSAAVSKLWHSIIQRSSLWRDAYYKLRHMLTDHVKGGVLPEIPPEDWMAQLVSEQHKAALVQGSIQIQCWKGHSTGVDRCRLQRGSIVTGVGDQMVRVWSSKSFRCLEEYSTPNKAALIDFDFDESKIVGLVGSDICIWRRDSHRHLLRLFAGQIQRAYCMSYVDPEAVVGCGDGTIRIFDMYSGQCSRIFRQHYGPVTCVLIVDEQFLINGTSLGRLSVSHTASGQKIACLRQSTASTGVSCLWANQGSYQVFAGTTSGHAYSWDLRTHKQLWEVRVSPNVIYSMHSLAFDSSALVLGGIDGVLRILDANSGDTLSSYVPAAKMNNVSDGVIAKCTANKVSSPLDRIPKSIRRPITCVAVGMNKVVTTHNDKNVMLWTFQAGKV